MLRILIIAWKELLELRRDRLTLAMMTALPIVLLLLFGYAINTDVRHIRLIVYDQDETRESRDLAQRLLATGFYDDAGAVRDYADVETSLRSGEARVALVVPPRYGSDIARGRTAAVQLVVDGSDPQIVASATDTATLLAETRGTEIRAERLGPASVQPISLEPSIWYNPDQRTAVFIVPGIIGTLLTMTMLMFTSMAMTRERERGTLEQLIVSPVRKLELVVGKILPYVGIGYVQMTLVLFFARVAFQVPLVGSISLLYVLSSLFIAANLALGLFFSTLAKTQRQAMQMSFFFTLPNILLSGFMFPFEAMPRPAQWLSQCLPLTHFLRIVRGIVLKGCRFTDLDKELFWMGGIVLSIVALTSFRFTKKLV